MKEDIRLTSVNTGTDTGYIFCGTRTVWRVIHAD